MNASLQLAKHFREVFFGKNWCTVNLKDTLAGVSWEQAVTRVHTFNTIATLTYHMGYYVTAVLRVLEGGPLDAHDKFSFSHPPIDSESDWQALQDKLWHEVEAFAALVEQLPEEMLYSDFTDGKYGIYFRNLFGIIEHTHYHLGQVVLIKKLLP